MADDRLEQFEPTGEDVYTFGSNPVAQAAAKGALANPESLTAFEELAASRAAR